MQTQQQILDNLNKLISSTSDQVLCNSDCQKNKKISQLQENIRKAQENIAIAPHQLQQAKQDYYKFILGDSKSKIQLEKEFDKQASIIVDSIYNSFLKTTQDALNDTNQSDNLTNIFQRMQKYYQNLTNQNKRNLLMNSKKIQQNLTDDRKTFYQYQKIDSLITWSYILFFLYYFIFLFYLYFTKHSILFAGFVFFIPFIIQFFSSLLFNWLGINHYIVVISLLGISSFFFLLSYIIGIIHVLFGLLYSIFFKII